MDQLGFNYSKAWSKAPKDADGIANSIGLNQTAHWGQSDLGLQCLLRLI